MAAAHDKAHKHGTDIATRKPRIDPLFNDAFIRIFGREDSKALTRSLVNSILRIVGIDPIGDINRIEAEYTMIDGSIECKAPRADIRLVSEKRVLDLEAQTYEDDIDNRFLLYASKLMAASFTKGMGYEDLPQVIVIILLDDAPRFPDTPEIVSRAQMKWDAESADDTEIDRIILVLVELEKFRRRYTGLSPEVLDDESLAWMYLLTRGYESEEDMMTILDQYAELKEFADQYGYAIDDPKVVQAYESYLSAERDYHARQRYLARITREAEEQGIERGIERGMKQGIERGAEQERQRLAARLKQMGVDPAVVDKAIAGEDEPEG